MKITKQRLKEIIKEELSRVLNEFAPEEAAQWAQLKGEEVLDPGIQKIEDAIEKYHARLGDLEAAWGRVRGGIHPAIDHYPTAEEHAKMDKLAGEIRDIRDNLGSLEAALEDPHGEGAEVLRAMGIDPKEAEKGLHLRGVTSRRAPWKAEREATSAHWKEEYPRTNPLTKQRLKEMIKEELSRVLNEEMPLKRWIFLDIKKQERIHKDDVKYIWALYQLKSQYGLTDGGVAARFSLESPEEGIPWTEIPGHEAAPYSVEVRE